MTVNRGKQFEDVIKKAFLKVPDVSIDRLHDQTNGFVGSSNICDFIVYKEPYEYYIECKTVHGASLPFRNISDNQWNGMLEKSKIQGVYAGVICWWVDKDVTLFIPIDRLDLHRYQGNKSIRYDDYLWMDDVIQIKGKKKRVFFDYDMTTFFEQPEDKEWMQFKD